jgi:hypothetical protein
MSTFDYVLGVSDFTAGTVIFTSAPFQIARGGYTARVGPIKDATVEEDISLRIMGGSIEANSDNLSTLQDLLLQAERRRDNKTLNPVYLYYRQNGSADIWRSEILTGSAEWDDNALTLDNWVGNTQFANVEWQRENAWNGPEAQVALTNQNGTANTSGLAVYNANDEAGTAPALRVNYVTINAASVTGELDGLTRLELTNTFDDARELYNVWIGQNYTDPLNADWIFEGEDATGGSVVAFGSSVSGGSYVSEDLASGTETQLFSWDLTSAQLDAFAGRTYKLQVRFFSASPTLVRFRVGLKWRNTLIWQTGLVSLANSVYRTLIRDLATFKLPPWVAGLTEQDPLELVLRGYQTTGVDQTVRIDFIQLTPLDGWRHLAAVGYGYELDWRIVDDGITGALYADEGGTARVGNLAGYGRPIALRPGVDQRLYFLMHSNSLDIAEVERSMTVKVYYRPRRRAL